MYSSSFVFNLFFIFTFIYLHTNFSIFLHQHRNLKLIKRFVGYKGNAFFRNHQIFWDTQRSRPRVFLLVRVQKGTAPIDVTEGRHSFVITGCRPSVIMALLFHSSFNIALSCRLHLILSEQRIVFSYWHIAKNKGCTFSTSYDFVCCCSINCCRNNTD